MDWRKLIEEIKESGLTQSEIAEKTGVPTGTISELLSGKVINPRWSSAAPLIALHEKVCVVKAA